MSAEHQGLSADEIALLDGDELDAEGSPKETEDDQHASAGADAADADTDQADEPDDTDEDALEEAPAAVAKPDAAALAAAEADAAIEKAKKPAEPAEGDDEEAEPVAAQQYQIDLPAEAETQRAALTAEKDAAFAEVLDGTMTAEAYKAIASRVEAAVRDIDAKVIVAQTLEAANAQHADQAARAAWAKAEAKSFAAFKAEGVDYKARPALLKVFGGMLQELAGPPDAPINTDKDAAWFQREAHRMTVEALGLPTTAAAAPAPAAKTAKPAPRGVDRTKLPPTLAAVPPAAVASTGGDEFAHMAALSGNDLEKAFARLTPEQQDRYLD